MTLMFQKRIFFALTRIYTGYITKIFISKEKSQHIYNMTDPRVLSHRESNKRYYESHCERLKARSKEYYASHREQVNSRCNEYYKTVGRVRVQCELCGVGVFRASLNGHLKTKKCLSMRL